MFAEYRGVEQMSFALGFLLGMGDSESISGGGCCMESPTNNVDPEDYPDPDE